MNERISPFDYFGQLLTVNTKSIKQLKKLILLSVKPKNLFYKVILSFFFS